MWQYLGHQEGDNGTGSDTLLKLLSVELAIKRNNLDAKAISSRSCGAQIDEVIDKHGGWPGAFITGKKEA